MPDWISLDNTVAWIDALKGHPWTPFAVVLAFVPAMLVMFPRPLITVAAVVVFGPWLGFTYSMVGVLLSSQLAFYAGTRVDEGRLKRWSGPKFDKLLKLLRKRGLVAVTAMRLLPGPPFVVESYAGGILRVKGWHMLVGTFLGMLPGMLATTVLGDQLEAWIAEGKEFNRWVVAGAIAALVALSWATHRWYRRQEN